MTVSIIVLVPSDRVEIQGRQVAAKLEINARVTSPATTLFCFEGGMMIAINIPKRATLNALTIRGDMIFPAMTPSIVPKAQPGSGVTIAP